MNEFLKGDMHCASGALGVRFRFAGPEGAGSRLNALIVTSIHPDFDGRIWKHARSLVEAGCQVRLICPWKVGDREVRDGVELHPFERVQRRHLRPVLVPLRLGRRLLPLLREADLVHFHDIDILPWMTLVNVVRPVVYDVHENYPDEMLIRDWIPHRLRKPLYYMVDAAERLLARVVRNCVLVVPAQDRRFSSTRLRVIHVRNYASRKLLTTVRDDYFSRTNTVVFTGAHHETNGSILLLDIAARCRAKGLDIKFVVTDRFASEAFRRRFLAAIDQLNLADRITIHPYVPAHEIMEVLNNAIAAISPNLRVSTQEKGIHTKLFEYMAAALPIVASDLAHQTELINATRAGVLARPEDPDTFVTALERLIADRGYALELGRNGQRAFVETYSWESQVPPLLSFYGKVLAARAAVDVATP